MKEVNGPGCGRENDLVSFLYDELDPDERMSFRSHVQECLSCGAEMAEFTNIRESVVAWRDEALVGVTSPVVQPAMIKTEPSALSALREFFNLSPLWLKGAVVFASILFCLFAVLAAARFRDTGLARVAQDPNIKKYSDQELNAVVDRRVQDELVRIKNSSPTVPAPEVVATEQISHRKATKRGGEFTSTSSAQKVRRPLSKDERQQLAADLRLIENPTDGQLDLLDDRINQ
jgi:anti-sigma factor RsiW